MYAVLFLNGYVDNVEEAFGYTPYTVKKRLAVFPSPAGKSQSKFSMAGKIKLFPARESLVGDIPAGGRENR